MTVEKVFCGVCFGVINYDKFDKILNKICNCDTKVNKSLQLIYTIGLPCTGKTGWATTFVNRSSNYVRISRDDILKMLITDVDFSNTKLEKLAEEIEVNSIIYALANEQNVIVDNSKYDNKHDEHIKYVVNNNMKGIKVIFGKRKMSDITLSECMVRDQNREKGTLGTKKITQIYNEYILKQKDNE